MLLKFNPLPAYKLFFLHLNSYYRSFNHSATTTEKLFPPNRASKSTVPWNAQITKNGRNGNVKEAESLFNIMPNKNIISWTAMLTVYSQNGEIVKARKLFDEMPERNIASYNAMISAYIRNKARIREAIELFDEMPERNSVTYSAMITGFLQAGMLHKAEKLYMDMAAEWRDPVCSSTLISGYLKMGRLEDACRVFEGMKEKNVVSWSAMVDGYCKEGRVLEARALFDKMPERNVVSWTAMIDGYLKFGYFDEGFGLFLVLRREEAANFNSFTLAAMFEACSNFDKYREGVQLHKLALCLGFDFDIFLGDSIICFYSTFGCTDEAVKIFDTSSGKDLVTWNSMISGYIQNGEIKSAFDIFTRMPQRDVVSWTAMICGFFKTGMIKKSIELFKLMPERDDVAWTAVISGLADNEKYGEAIRWFIQMLRESVRPNALTLSSVISASAFLAILKQGLQLHACLVKMDMEFDLSVQNSLVSMYSKCGEVAHAYQVFKQIRAPNIVSFNSMIIGFAQNGFAEAALELFKSMKQKGEEPNEVTFLGVLSACVHAGMVKEGWNYFNSMRSLYKIEPGPDHYACMVDLLGRAGLMDEAIALINSMHFKPHSGVWGALLSASRNHSRIDLANLAAEKLFELDPSNPAGYLVISDIYSLSGKMMDGELVRRLMKSRGFTRNPGCSWVA